VFLLEKAVNVFPQCCRQSQRIWSYVEKSQETGSCRYRTGSREINSSPNWPPGQLELSFSPKVESRTLFDDGAVLTK
jgi:hypothetical protein